MPKKKNKPTAFSYFMKDIQERYAKNGQHIKMSEIPQFAAPLWKQMSVAEKKKYEEKAKGQKVFLSADEFRLTSDGTSIKETFQILEDEENREKQIIYDVKSFVGASDDCDQEQFKMDASKSVIYVISFNVLCAIEEDDLYIPLEIGIIEYSIKNGINRTFHSFIYPGVIPAGYTGEAKRHSEDSHLIPITGHEDCEKNYRVLVNKIFDFINPTKKSSLPPVFCLKDNIPQVSGCLYWLVQRARTLELPEFKVLDLVYLLLELRSGAGEPLISYFIALELLTKNTFDYCLDTRCEFHEEQDNRHCALGVARRLCFLMSDCLCGVFNIEPTDKHLPVLAVEEKPYEVVYPAMKSTVPPEPLMPRGIGRGIATFFDRKPGLPLASSGIKQSYQESPATSSASSDIDETNPRQPRSVLTHEFANLHLNTSTIAPGQGIGRGQRIKK